jgi:WD40 repeat protein
MALRPEERYATAREFAADLGAWLAAGGVGLQPGVDGRQVANLPHEEAVHSTPTQPYRLRPAAPAPPAKAPPPPRPRRFVAVAAALALVGVVALLAWWLLSPSAVGEAVGGALALARPTPGPADIEPEPLDLAPGAALSPKALVTRPASLKKDVRSWTVETREPRGVVHAVAYRPDGRQVALAGEDGMVRVLDTASGALVRLLVAHGGPVRGLDWSPNGRFLASAGEDGVVCLWGAEAGRLLRRLRDNHGAVHAVCWSPDGETLATGGEDGQVRFRRAADGKLLEGGVKHGGAVLALAWSPDGRLVASAGWEKWVRVWDVGSCQPLPPLDAHRPPSPVSALAWSPNSRTLATAGPDQQIRLWLAAEGKNERTIAAGASVTALAWARATGELAAGTQKGVAIYDRSGDPVRSHKMESGVVWALAWSPDGKKFVAANDDAVRTREANDRSVTLATCHPASRAATAHGPLGRASVAWSPDGRTLAVAGFSDRALRFWDGQTGAFRPEKADGPCESTLAWSPDGKSLAVAAGDTVRLWDETGHRWSGAELKCASDVLALAWSPDGKSLAAGLDGGEVWLWRDGQSHPLTPPAKRLGGVFAVVWSPDGQVVAGGTNGTLLFWPAGGGKPSQVPVHAQVPIKALAWSPDGALLVSGDGARPVGVSGRVQFWKNDKPAPRQPHHDAEGHTGGVSACVWSADSKVLATGGADGALRFWQADNGKLQSELPGHTAAVSSLSWRPRSDTLAVAGRDGTVRLGRGDGRGYRALLVPLLLGRGLALNAEGHFTASPDVESSLVVVVQTEQGQGVYSPAEFRGTFGWKNDPDRVPLGAK